jgi:8-oxo-dGTP diphosphatase
METPVAPTSAGVAVVVVLGFDGSDLLTVLVPSREASTPGLWRFPEGSIEGHIQPTEAAYAALEQLGAPKPPHLEPLSSTKSPEGNPADRGVSLGYLGLMTLLPQIGPRSYVQPNAAGAYTSGQNPRWRWQPVDSVPPLPKNHVGALEYVRTWIRTQLPYSRRCLELLPNRFTWGQLQRAHETVLGCDLEKRNFRKRFQQTGLIRPRNEVYLAGAHRPAQLFEPTPVSPI